MISLDSRSFGSMTTDYPVVARAYRRSRTFGVDKQSPPLSLAVSVGLHCLERFFPLLFPLENLGCGTYQKRNIGANLTLCIAPLFFCIILAVIQVLVNTLIASNEDLSCGCRCTSCCYSWALKNAPGVFTFDGNSTIRVTDVQRFQRQWASQLADIPPGTITSNADGTLSIQVCSPLNNGPCSSSDGFSCRATDKNLCGIQFSTAFQSQFCAVPKASAWPALLQVPATRARAKPWGALRVGNITVPQVGCVAGDVLHLRAGCVCGPLWQAGSHTAVNTL
ncbi:ABC transporter domain-containing protein [Haematococcus lacustris]|uniref:ABC transporter domain-containing protein n=1 Tax=Haematococcus lacustris TaxID=44745 RepID=A0A699Y8D5_HAELA|nr:ABC transporter domain-containing protein [Haematococcus lacustris]